jgi:hypothetical protein
MIKYWNLEDVDETIQQSDYREKIYNKDRKEWTDLLDKYKQTGVNVHKITSGSEKEILNQLAFLDNINPG